MAVPVERQKHQLEGTPDAGKLPEEDDIGQIVHAPIDKLGPIGRWIRHRLVASILIGEPVLLAVQQYRTPLLTKTMKMASFFGTEEFYAMIVCLVTWIVDVRLARLCCIVMGIGFYVGNFFKNSLCLPRPRSPPVQPLENAFNTWALPSHHAVLGVVIPWYIWFYAILHYNFSTIQYVILFTLIVTWSSSVMFSRVYLGVHSPADVVVGSLVGILILAIWFRFDDIFDRATVLSNQGAALVPLYAAILLFLHPRPEIETLSFAESNSMVSVGVGFVLARAMAVGRYPAFKAVVETYVNSPVSYIELISISIARFITGTILVVLSKVIIKKVMECLVIGLYRMFEIEFYTSNKRRLYFNTGYGKHFILPPVNYEEKKNEEETVEPSTDSNVNKPWNVDHPVRFVTYVGMGYTCNFVAPLVFQYIGLVL